MIYFLNAIVLKPVTVKHYTFIQKQYTEQHNEKEYRERNIRNNKNT